MTRWMACLPAAAALVAVVAAAPGAPPAPRGAAGTAGPPAMDRADVVRLAEAFRLAGKLGDRLWKGWRRAPFAVLLVTPEAEYLVRHPNPPEEFVPAGYERALHSEVRVARRTHPVNLLATFPINGVPTVVAGRAQDTDEKTSTRWIAVVLHEHFHQFQYVQPDYAEAVESLGLSHGDASGAWMLNYPFPYDAIAVKARFEPMVRALSDALGSVGTDDFANRFSAYLRAREILLAGLSSDERKYFAFVTWQEGVAQYTQYRIAEMAARRRYRPTPEFARLPDFTTFAEVAERLRENLRSELPNLPLSAYRRVVFYYVGAAEALMLDAAVPGWRDRYFEELSLERFLTATGYTPDSAAAPAPRR